MKDSFNSMVYICSPFRGDVKKNLTHARAAVHYSLRLGESPVAPHVFYTSFLNDSNEDDRRVGLEAGLNLLKNCNSVKVFGDTMSSGMKEEIELASRLGIPITFVSWQEVIDTLKGASTLDTITIGVP